MAEVLVPRDNVNDDFVILLKWMVGAGERVEAGAAVAEIETSKATVELQSEEAGYFWPLATEGAEVPVGSAIALVSATPERPAGAAGRAPAPAAAAPVAAAVPVPVAAPTAVLAGESLGAAPEVPVAFSRRARELLERHGLDEARFAGRGLIREIDVQAALGLVPAPSAPPTAPSARPAPAPKGRAAVARIEPLTAAKRTEIRYLTEGHRAALMSAVTVLHPAAGLDAAIAERAAPSANGAGRRLSYLDFVLVAAAAALREHPELNAFYADDGIHHYAEVNIGVAFNLERGLRVPVVRLADSKGVEAVSREIGQMALRYLRSELTETDLTGGTFTLTDLSGSGVFQVLPLINRDQTAILALGCEPDGRGGATRLNLTLSFDHRVIDGQQGARFLQTLVQHLDESAPPPAPAELQRPGPLAGSPECSSCLLPLSRLARDGVSSVLVSVVGPDGETSLLCRPCLLGFNG